MIGTDEADGSGTGKDGRGGEEAVGMGVGEDDTRPPIRLFTVPVGSETMFVRSEGDGSPGRLGETIGKFGNPLGTPGRFGIAGTPFGRFPRPGKPGRLGSPGVPGRDTFGVDGRPGAPIGACNDDESKPAFALKPAALALPETDPFAGSFVEPFEPPVDAAPELKVAVAITAAKRIE